MYYIYLLGNVLNTTYCVQVGAKAVEILLMKQAIPHFGAMNLASVE